MDIAPEELETCLRVLQQVSEDPAVMNDHARFKSLIAKIHKSGKKGERRVNRQQQSEADCRLRADTTLVQAQRHAIPAGTLPELEFGASGADKGTLNRPQTCYICKQPYMSVHFFYHLLCPACAAFNYAKRGQRADLSRRIALVTGGRIKIGYQTALRLLRDGARVLVTTRFPNDAARRFGTEPDFGTWQERLQIYGLDLRNLPAVEAFACHLLQAEPYLDILINNAAQTIKRPPEFYRHLLTHEQAAPSLPAAPRVADWNAAGWNVGEKATPDDNVGLLPYPPALAEKTEQAKKAGQYDVSQDSGPFSDAMQFYFPPGQFDADGQALDLRPANSWKLELAGVSTAEMLEVQLVNAVAPFVLNSRLKPLMLRSPFSQRFIVNVSAVEGQFNRAAKTWDHPHTNMAKAALNMMTRTSAQDYARDGIYMNSVDTGWITDENPYPERRHLQEQRHFYTPLDAIDGMARVYDPIAQELNRKDLNSSELDSVATRTEPLYGQFLKDYVPCPW